MFELNKFAAKNESEASLENMSSSFKINLIKKNDVIQFSFTAKENNISNGNASINYLSFIDDDLLYHIMKQFVEFEKWW